MNDPSPRRRPQPLTSIPLPSLTTISGKISIDRLPEDRKAEALRAIAGLEGDSLQDLIDRGVRSEHLAEDPEQLDALTDPHREHGEALVHLLSQCDALGKLIQDRHTMRRLAARMRAALDAEVHELTPEDVPEDLSPFPTYLPRLLPGRYVKRHVQGGRHC